MQLTTLDWSFIIGFFVFSLIIGLVVARRSGKSSAEYFLSGRTMPWWLLGISMVATTFSADTPNLVTDIVRKNGVSGNWVWWAFLVTGMLTVFVYAKLWRRSGISTDLEFYELRYSGRPAAFLRGFRAIYLGFFFNVMIMATVCLAAVKIGGVLLGLSPEKTLLISSVVTVLYTGLGGLRGVIWTDFFQFILAMIGTVWAAMVIVDLPEIGGLDNLLNHENVVSKLDFLPDFNNLDIAIPLIIIPLAVQWWSVWYPGAEPGGGGYVAQRMLSAKDEKNAIGATLLYNIAHYALRPWPWILIALASLVMYPDLDSLAKAFPDVDPDVINDDLAYPAMLTFLPSGLLGLVIASLIAAFMSTISSHLNWGASYISHDFYKRFINPRASERRLVNVGRIATVILMAVSAIVSLQFESALEMFNILLQIGAGTGLIFILRWFWWRINAWSEVSAMVISFAVAVYFAKFYVGDLADWEKMVLGITVTTFGWLFFTMITQPTSHSKLVSFYKIIKPHSGGWRHVIEKGLHEGSLKESQITVGKLPGELLSMFLGIFLVYSVLFGTGYFLYGNMLFGMIGFGIAALSAVGLRYFWKN